jgi:hypothetical protein
LLYAYCLMTNHVHLLIERQTASIRADHAWSVDGLQSAL